MANTPEQIAAVVLYFRYAGEFLGFHFEEENFQILLNINTLEGIPISWTETWEMDGRRGLWEQCIERENAKRYNELLSKYGVDRALGKLNSERRDRMMSTELNEEEVCEALEQVNAEFVEAEDRLREDEKEKCLDA